MQTVYEACYYRFKYSILFGIGVNQEIAEFRNIVANVYIVFTGLMVTCNPESIAVSVWKNNVIVSNFAVLIQSQK